MEFPLQNFEDVIPDLVASDLTLEELGAVLCFVPIEDDKQKAGIARRLSDGDLTEPIKSLRKRGLLEVSINDETKSLTLKLDLEPLQTD